MPHDHVSLENLGPPAAGTVCTDDICLPGRFTGILASMGASADIDGSSEYGTVTIQGKAGEALLARHLATDAAYSGYVSQPGGFVGALTSIGGLADLNAHSGFGGSTVQWNLGEALLADTGTVTTELAYSGRVGQLGGFVGALTSIGGLADLDAHSGLGGSTVQWNLGEALLGNAGTVTTEAAYSGHFGGSGGFAGALTSIEGLPVVHGHPEFGTTIRQWTAGEMLRGSLGTLAADAFSSRHIGQFGRLLWSVDSTVLSDAAMDYMPTMAGWNPANLLTADGEVDAVRIFNSAGITQLEICADDLNRIGSISEGWISALAAPTTATNNLQIIARQAQIRCDSAEGLTTICPAPESGGRKLIVHVPPVSQRSPLENATKMLHSAPSYFSTMSSNLIALQIAAYGWTAVCTLVDVVPPIISAFGLAILSALTLHSYYHDQI